jgi:hypothetical protein
VGVDLEEVAPQHHEVVRHSSICDERLSGPKSLTTPELETRRCYGAFVLRSQLPTTSPCFLPSAP